MASTAFNSGPFAPRLLRSGSQSRSLESLQTLDKLPRRVPDASLKQVLTVPRDAGKVEQTSRLELLLLARTPKPAFIPEHDSAASQVVNQSIKASSQWDEIRNIVEASPTLSSSNLAFAIYRLGCFSANASKKRVNDLKASNLVPDIFERAMAQSNDMEPSSLVLLLDGCARLQHRPSNQQLTRLATLVQQNAYSMYARQLPLVLWAFSSLNYTPRSEVLHSLEDAVCRQASELSPQGMALVLSSFHAADFSLTDFTLGRLAEVIQRKLLLFKPSDLATCLKGLSAQNFKAPGNFLQAIMERSGHTSDHAARHMSSDLSNSAPRLALNM